MLLAIDVGNSNTVIGVFEDDCLTADWRVATREDRTADELGILIRNLLSAKGLDPSKIDSAVISCVVPPLTPGLDQMTRNYFAVEPMFVEPGIRTGIAVVSENPQEVGADRIVNAVAAHARCRGPVIVIDLGTATTLDAISGQGEYLGGAIAPGIDIAAEALFLRTSKLPRVEVRRPPRVIGRNTVQCVQSGLYHGYVGLISRLVEMMKKELEGEVRVLATGGNLQLIREELADVVHEVVPHLTLEGLRLIHERNR
ncbi:MAG: type III pantothenate kinase [Acidobacteriota bacterium]